MRSETSLAIKLLEAPNFLLYEGGDAFTFQNKIFQKHGEPLGRGAYGKVFCFEADDHTQCAVKAELPNDYDEYHYGYDFKVEASWYQKIYGVGVFSGNINDKKNPHYILMPYFKGKTLYGTTYLSLEQIVMYWIKTADAVNQIHKKHQAVHCDLKADNIIIDESEKAFIIDFGFMTPTNHPRNDYVNDTPENRKQYGQQPPEIFTTTKQRRQAHPTQDIYALGILLFYLHAQFLQPEILDLPSIESIKSINAVKENLILHDPVHRWCIAKAIYFLITACFTKIPRPIWVMMMDDTKFNKLDHEKMMLRLWRTISTIAVYVRQKELQVEQNTLEHQHRKSKRKEEKINGLRRLRSEIEIANPAQLGKIIVDTKKLFPELTAGIFSRRTETLLNELTQLTPMFH